MKKSDAPKPKGWFSEYHEQPIHPTITVVQDEPASVPRLILPDGREMVAKKTVGFRPR